MSGRPGGLLRRNRNFALLWWGGAVSGLGSRASSMAYPLLVLAIGGSASDAGLVGFAATAPYLFLLIVAGVVIDRVDRRAVLLVTDAGRAVVLGLVVALVVTGGATVPLLVAAALTEGTLSVFHTLAQRSAVRAVVADADVGTALSWNEAAVRGAMLAGQPLGGVLFALGRAVPFVADLVSYVVSLATVTLLRGDFRPGGAPPPRPLAAAGEGFAWLWREPFVRATTIAVAGSNVVFQALLLTVVVTATRDGASPVEVGLIMAGAGTGGVLGAVAAPALAARLSPRASFLGANVLWAAGVPLVIVASSPVATACAFGLFAFGGAVSNVVVGAYQLRVTPNHLLGRVNAVIGTVSFGLLPLGPLLGGVLVDTVGSDATLGILAVAMAGIAAAVAASPSIRTVETPVAIR